MKKLFTTLVLIYATAAVFAQTGTIAGRVIDPMDNGLARAKIQLLDSAGNVAIKKSNVISDFGGDYSIKDVKPGYYLIKVTHKDFTAEILDAVIVAEGKTTFSNFRMYNKVAQEPIY
ncbi:MAG TPA: carboxypeptidase-like regulatory domain-containing protein [Chitinophagales bacterium]|nr:carboxypeptidase-like regulatory domain-containing protein [Chitinophagales bacterium]